MDSVRYIVGSKILNSKVIYCSLIKIKFLNVCKVFDLELLQIHILFLVRVRSVSDLYLCCISSS